MTSTPPQHEPERDPGEHEQPAAARFGVGHRLIAALFAIWHRALVGVASVFVRAGHALSSVWRSWTAQWIRVRDYHASSDQPWTSEHERERRTAAAVGLRAFVAGMLLAAVAAASTENAWAVGAVTVMAEVLWTGARFIIIALLVPRAAIDRHRLSIAYLAGLAPYVFGTTALLRLVALAASAFLTRRGLMGACVPRPDANRAIAWSFGGQLAAYAAGLVLRAGVALLSLL